MNEATARRISLAQAIETADSQHRLLGVAQRRQIDAQELREAGPSRQPPTPADLEDFLDRRARLLLAAVQESHPAVAALQQPPAWPRRLAIAAPVAALLAGLLTDRIANPHRVDLLSLPLLGIVLWNLVLYALMLGRWLLVRSPGTGPAWPGLRHALDGWLAGRYRRAPQDVRLAFALLWSRLAAGLQRLRLERVLHLCAAGLAAGVLLSLVTRGLVVEYRVGWESTFLDAPQVHRLLRLLLAPADALLPWPPYSVDEIARLRFGESGGAPNAARWVVLHAVLLLELVVLPRLLLAGWSWWRERRLAARLALDLEQPYFQHLVAQRWPARIVLGLHAPDPGARATAVRLLRQPAQEKDMSQEGELLLSSAEGDTLLLRELAQLPAPAPIETESGWTQRLRGRWGRGRAQRTTLSTAPFDLLLLAVATPDELVAAAPALPGLARPLLLLAVPPGDTAESRAQAVAALHARARSLGLQAPLLDFDAVGRCWVQEAVLLRALKAQARAAQAPGWERLAQAWNERNRLRLVRSMAVLAAHLQAAARELRQVPGSTLTVRRVLSPAEREAAGRARQEAIGAIAQQLQARSADSLLELLRLHGADSAQAVALEHRLGQDFRVHEAVDAPQAGIAGAATGAAMGASVDLLAGGMTLGAAAALGALVGGAAGVVGAALRNREAAGGATSVQAGDEMLQALAEEGLLHYLAAAHQGRGPGAPGLAVQPGWRAEVVAAVQTQRARLLALWVAARQAADPSSATALALVLEDAAQAVLARLYPGSLAAEARRAD